MRVLIAPDKFKGSLTAKEAADAIENGIGERAMCTKVPLADGGEGTAAILTHNKKGYMAVAKVDDPLRRKINAEYGISHDNRVAYIEMASASGLSLLTEGERNPLVTTSIGTGQLIVDAVSRGARHVVLGIGGTATNDGGAGIAHALGVRFKTADQKDLGLPSGDNLLDIEFIDTSGILNSIRQTRFTVLCDVQNPLTGHNGAAYTFAPQKGANEEQVLLLNRGLVNLAHRLRHQFNIDPEFPGAGAGGGVGALLSAVVETEFKSGIEYLLKAVEIERHVADADLVITGEGKFDGQTLGGKVVFGLAEVCKKHDKPLIVIAGHSDLPESTWRSLGIKHVLTLARSKDEVAEVMSNPVEFIARCLAANVRLFEA